MMMIKPKKFPRGLKIQTCLKIAPNLDIFVNNLGASRRPEIVPRHPLGMFFDPPDPIFWLATKLGVSFLYFVTLFTSLKRYHKHGANLFEEDDSRK